MPYDEFLTFMFFDWNIFSMQDKKNTIHTEKKKINIHIATGKHPLSFLSKDHDLSKFSNSFKTRLFKISCSTWLNI